MGPDISCLPETIIRIVLKDLTPNACAIKIFWTIGIFQRAQTQKELIKIISVRFKYRFIIITGGVTFTVEIIVKIKIVEQEESSVVIAIITNKLVGHRCLRRHGFNGGMRIGQRS